jgi:hypothetical protein
MISHPFSQLLRLYIAGMMAIIYPKIAKGGTTEQWRYLQ